MAKTPQNNTQRTRRGPGHGNMYTGEKAKDTKKTIKRTITYLNRRKGLVALVVILSLAATAANLFIPMIFARGIDNYIMKLDYNGIFKTGVILISIGGLSGLFSWLQNYIMADVTQKTVKEIREDAFLKLQKLPIKYFDSNIKGTIMSRLTNDVETIANALSQAVVQIFTSIITVVGALILLFISSWHLGIVTILFIPIMIVFTVVIAKKSFPLFKAQQQHLAAINGVVEESIQGFKAIKLYSQEKKFIEDFEDKNQKFKKASFKAMLYSGVIFPVINFMNNLIYVVLVIVGGFLSLRYGIITPGNIAAATSYARQFIRPISNLSQLLNSLQAAIAGAERVYELIDEEDEYLMDHDYVSDSLKGEIRFEEVTFGYDENVVLEDISFWVKRNQVAAIVGPTGSGKTTIINLINRFYDVKDGKITVDGIDIKDYKKDEYRKAVGVVFQDTELFTGTVYDNIRYGNQEATKEEIIQAAKYANCDGFISRLPKGYQTIVEEGGSNFSHGERQLISIARTILSNPDILILDEATSSVDTRTEKNIQESMRNLMEGRTSIVIAHRLQTILNADVILVVKDGKIIERGTHQHLMELNGFYADMYKIQFKQV
ncbi:ABC transporter ATP-binding protein [Mycoplasmatota bacterium]|nr:ABC transporter ATP-binding protein [Mycoplasmatota bacterium]